MSGNRDNHVGGTGGFSHSHLFILIWLHNLKYVEDAAFSTL
jgi:hypothetical protein